MLLTFLLGHRPPPRRHSRSDSFDQQDWNLFLRGRTPRALRGVTKGPPGVWGRELFAVIEAQAPFTTSLPLPLLVCAITHALVAAQGTSASAAVFSRRPGPLGSAKKLRTSAAAGLLDFAGQPKAVLGALLLNFLEQLPEPVFSQGDFLAFRDAKEDPTGVRKVLFGPGAHVAEPERALGLHMVYFLRALADSPGGSTHSLCMLVAPALFRESEDKLDKAAAVAFLQTLVESVGS